MCCAWVPAWEIDALAADMMAHSLQLQGVASRSASHALTPALGPEEMADWGQAQWLVLSTFHAQPQALVRQILRRVRRRYPQLKVVLTVSMAAPPCCKSKRWHGWGPMPWPPACSSCCCAWRS